MTKKKRKSLSKKIARIGAGIAAVGRNYKEHEREIGAFAKKIRGEWNSAKVKAHRVAKKARGRV